MKFCCIKNSYVQEKSDSLVRKNDDAFASITIGVYPADSDAEGEVVAVVWCSLHGDIIVDWHNNGYRCDKDVLMLIEESKRSLCEMFNKTSKKTDFQMIQELKKAYTPREGGIVFQDEANLIWNTLQLGQRTNTELQNIRDMVVMLYSQWTGENESACLHILDAMSAITYVIDKEKVKRGLPV